MKIQESKGVSTPLLPRGLREQQKTCGILFGKCSRSDFALIKSLFNCFIKGSLVILLLLLKGSFDFLLGGLWKTEKSNWGGILGTIVFGADSRLEAGMVFFGLSR